MTIFRSVRGRWEPYKKPVAWAHQLDLECGVCQTVAHFEGVGELREAQSPYDLGEWRILQDPTGASHSDPLRERDVVVCSRACAETMARDSIERTYGPSLSDL